MIPKEKGAERMEKVTIRILEEDNALLEYVSSELGITKSKLIRNTLQREIAKLRTVYGR